MGLACWTLLDHGGRMASLHRHPRTSFWILRLRDPATGLWKSKSLGLRHDDPEATRKAQRIVARAAQDEARMFGQRGTDRIKDPQRKPGVKNLGARRENPTFASWVPGYIATHYRNEHSRKRYLTVWLNIQEFLSELRITGPAAVRYQHGRRYFEWRRGLRIHSRGEQYGAGHNTTLLEVKFFSFLMNEAVRREFIAANPLVRLGIGKEAQAEKRELSDEAGGGWGAGVEGSGRILPPAAAAGAAAGAARERARWMLFLALCTGKRAAMAATFSLCPARHQVAMVELEQVANAAGIAAVDRLHDAGLEARNPAGHAGEDHGPDGDTGFDNGDEAKAMPWWLGVHEPEFMSAAKLSTAVVRRLRLWVFWASHSRAWAGVTCRQENWKGHFMRQRLKVEG